MRIEYDPNKNARNILLRGLSFDQVADLDWDSAVIFEDKRHDYGERRLVALAYMAGRLHNVCFVPLANDYMRVISFRKAHKKEIAYYETIRQES